MEDVSSLLTSISSYNWDVSTLFSSINTLTCCLRSSRSLDSSNDLGLYDDEAMDMFCDESEIVEGCWMNKSGEIFFILCETFLDFEQLDYIIRQIK